MTINVGDVVQVVVSWEAANTELAQNVWHMEMVSGAGADPADVLDAIRTQYRVAFADLDDVIANDWSITQYELLQRDTALHQWDGVSVLGETTLVGLDAGDFMPHGVACILRYSTALSRRQGRMFIPGVAIDDMLGGELRANTQAAILAFAADWGTDISVTGGLLQLCTYNVDPVSVYYETSSLADGNYISNAIPGYQRRRKPGVGA